MFNLNKINLTLNSKLIGGFLLVGIVPLALLSWVELKSTETVLTKEIKSRLSTISSTRKNQVEEYISSRIDEGNILSTSTAARNSIQGFNFAFQIGGGIESPIWEEANKIGGLQFETYQEHYGYEDLFIVSSEGMVLYSVLKGKELGSNLKSGPFSKTPLAETFLASKNSMSFKDFSPSGSSGKPMAFIGTPVVGEEGEHFGTIIFKLSYEKIGSFLTDKTGLGITGDSYLVGPEGLMRSDSLRDNKNFSVEASFKNSKKVLTSSVKSALAGKVGVEIINNYINNEVLSSYMPVKVGDVTWALISEIDTAEVFSPLIEIQKKVLYITCGIIMFVLFIAIFISKSISNPILIAISSLKTSSSRLFKVSNQFLESSEQLSEGASAQASALEETSAAMEEMAAQSKKNSENASDSSKSAQEIDMLLKNSVENINMANSLAGDTRNSADNGVKTMSEIAASMEQIMEDSQKVTDIIEVINEITHQTKMLATNAAIEAARAGEYGKGFAVVADEVSKLAESSKESAKSISSLIKVSVKNSEKGTQLAQNGKQVLQDILDKSVSLSDLVNEVCFSAKEQEESMRNINQMIGGIKDASEEQSTGSQQISLSLVQMDTITQNNAHTAQENLNGSDVLKKQVTSQKNIIEKLSSVVGDVDIDVNAEKNVNNKNKKTSIIKKMFKAKDVKKEAPVKSINTNSGNVRRIQKPSEVIPMKDDNDFSDFMTG